MATGHDGANGVTNGTSAPVPETQEKEQADTVLSNAPPGVVLPPRLVREFIERVSVYVARNGVAFEEKVRGNAASTSKVAFLSPEDPYNAYYKWRVAEVKAGRGTDPTATAAPKTDVSFQGRQARQPPPPPPDFQFSARMPTISAQDLDVVRLTALYAAKNGRQWITTLSQREAGNYQFDFLRPQHSLNMFFTRLIEQYRLLLNADSTDSDESNARIADLTAKVKNRLHILDRAKSRAEYVRYQESQKKEQAETLEKDRVAFAQIDWHDFIVVETVLFDERDDNADHKAPMTLNDLQSRSLEQKAAMRIGSDRRIEESVPTFDEYETFYGSKPPMPAAQLPVQDQHSQLSTPPNTSLPRPPATLSSATSSTTQSEADRSREQSRQQQPARIITGYVPQAQRRKQAANTSICPNCKMPIPNDELNEHMRIEMIDPRWREQSRLNQQRSATTNLSTVDVANNLKRLASQRTDVFDPITGQAISEEEQNRRKRAELQAYDGVSSYSNPSAQGFPGQQLASGPPGTSGNAGTILPPGPPGTERPDVQEQIRYLHDKYKKT